MLVLDAKTSADRFICKLRDGKFTAATSANSELNYHNEKLQRDSEGFDEFLESDLAKHIVEMR